ncbi:MAG: hypothetical protein HZA89_03220 [Verrucomicrobia bacterium]|nr:hypothetical protein [Verrucomicrobiota bacterium]
MISSACVFVVVALMAPAPCASAAPADPNATPQADALWSRLEYFRSRDLFLFGQHHANLYGINTNNARWLTDNNSNTNRSDVKSVTGSHPALFGFSPTVVVGMAPNPESWLSVAEWQNRIKDAHRWGGVIQIYYPPEKVFYTNGWVEPTLDSVQTNGLHYAALTNHIHAFADMLDGLLDDSGDPIPIVLRPWHEHTGGWFWWSPGNNATDKQQYINLFRSTVDILRARGHNSSLTALSPSGHRLGVDREYLFAYPGDGYVDIFGFDMYFLAPRDYVDQGGGYPTNSKSFTLDTQFWEAINVTADAVLDKETNGITKLMAIAEFGPPDGIWGNTNLTAQTATNFYDGLFLPGLTANVTLARRQLISYAMVWRNASVSHGWMPNTTHGGVQDTVDFYNAIRVSFLNEQGAHWRLENNFSDAQAALPLSVPTGATAPTFGTNVPNLPLPGIATNSRSANFNPAATNVLETTAGEALAFDGDLRSYTMEAWLKLDTLPPNGGRSVIISAKPAGTNDAHANYVFHVTDTGRLAVTFGDGATNSATLLAPAVLTVTTGAWAHASLAFDQPNNRFRFTLNGNRQFTANSAAFRPTPVQASRVTLGGWRAPAGGFTNLFDGRLDEIRFTASLLATNLLLYSNTAPVVSALADLTIAEDTATPALAFTISDAETAASQLTLSGVSSNTNLVAANGIALGGSGSNRTVTVTPLTNQFGTATITVTVSDGFASTNETFLLTVTSVNDVPVLAPVANRTVNAGDTLTVTNSVTDVDLPPQLLIFSLLTAPSNASLNATSGVFAWRPGLALAGTTNSVTISVADSGAPTLSATQNFSVVIGLPTAPGISTPILTNGRFRLLITGATGADFNYTVETSADLVTWQALSSTNPPAAPFFWLDTRASNFSTLFYRVLLGP